MDKIDTKGTFYLGKIIDSSKPDDGSLLLYDSKNLTTHAMCVGMTGSGKTGLGIAMIEEAALNKIPCILIDPKGDLSNLLLTFPHLSPEDFLPWIDSAEAERKGMTTENYAVEIAKSWQNGLKQSGEGPERIQKLRDAVDMVIYTPASTAGIPISILSSFAAPPKELMLDSGALRDRVMSLTSSILGLLGIDADPIKSREHILISTIISQAWQKGENLDISSIIQQVQRPPFDKIGALDIDTFYPNKDRIALSISLNNLLASPGFKAWMEGEPLDIQSLLYTSQNKPKLSIISIAHLSDAERMFFVTLLLNEFLSWMRRQTGTSNLRALFYMDEIFGFFPPVANPPSKTPMLTLLKQSRAFGVGIILCTQNPVDLDYKGLSNCGTWFIGKLQTERDKARVLEGLQIASNGDIDSSKLDKMLSNIQKRTFIMRSIYEKDPIIFQTRWTMSYLRGPLTLPQIATLTDKTALKVNVVANQDQVNPSKSASSERKPIVPLDVPEVFINRPGVTPPAQYKPYVVGVAKVHFVDSKAKIDVWQDLCVLGPADDNGKTVSWEKSSVVQDGKKLLASEPLPNSTFQEVPSGLLQSKNYSGFQKALEATLYQTQSYTIYVAPEQNLTSKEGESEAEFRKRISQIAGGKRDELVAKLREKYSAKIAALNEKVRRAQEKMTQKQQSKGWQIAETVISFGTTLLGALLGRGVTKGTINSAGTSIRRAGRVTKDSSAATAAEQEYNNYKQQLDDLQKQMNDELAQIATDVSLNKVNIETSTIKPRKSDITIEKIALAWWPLV